MVFGGLCKPPIIGSLHNTKQMTILRINPWNIETLHPEIDIFSVLKKIFGLRVKEKTKKRKEKQWTAKTAKAINTMQNRVAGK